MHLNKDSLLLSGSIIDTKDNRIVKLSRLFKLSSQCCKHSDIMSVYVKENHYATCCRECGCFISKVLSLIHLIKIEIRHFIV